MEIQKKKIVKKNKRCSNMSREKELVKNTLILSMGKFLPKFAAIITLPILSGCFTKTEYGMYDLITTLVMLVLPIATLQIQSAAFRFLIDTRGDKDKSTIIITNIFAVTVPISLIVSIIVQFFFWTLSVPIRIWIAVYLFIDTIFLSLCQIARGLGENKDYSIGAILVSLINMIGVVLTVWLGEWGLIGVLVSLSVANVIASVFVSFKIHVWRFIDLSKTSSQTVKQLLAYSWPMVPNNLSNWVLKLSDRFVITGFLGIEANATYGIANRIPNLLSIAQSVLVMAWHENASMAAKDTDKKEYYSKMLERMFNLMFGCTVLLVAATPVIFKVLIRGDYGDAYYQMPMLILGMFFFVMSSFFGGIYVAYKKTVNVGISTIIAAGINLIVDFALITFVGIWAGSISTLVSYVVLYYYRMFNCQTFQPLIINYKKQTIQIGIMIIMLTMCFYRMIVLDIINVLAGLALFALFNREVIKSGKTLIKSKLLKK